MSIRLISMFPYLLLAPGSAISISSGDSNSMLLLYPFESLDVVLKDRTVKLQKGVVIIGPILKVVNPGMRAASFRGILFSVHSMLHNSSTSIIREHDQPRNVLVTKLLNTPLISQSNIDHATRLLNELYTLGSVDELESDSGLQQSVTNKIDPRLLLVNQYIRKHYNQPVTLQSLANLIGCNPVYLSNMYSRVFNISPMRYLQTIRMKKARQLLVTTKLSIAEVSRELGYVSGSQFSQLFKRYYGTTPYQYRVNHFLSSSGNVK